MNNTSEQVIKKKTAIDFKMVTFSIAGKEYAIDIMKVKEISKERNFTYVPNAPMYVLGVHNLRGEIIPIIDLRKMFHLPVNETGSNEEDVLILSVEDLTLGIVVDSIDRVVGISKEQVQEPHPLFSDVNIRYISGVVDTGGTLYVILDVERIFGKEEVLAESHMKKVTEKTLPVKTTISESGIKELTLQFITETLSALKSFHVTDLNNEWVERRFKEWKNIREAENLKLQLENIQDKADPISALDALASEIKKTINTMMQSFSQSYENDNLDDAREWVRKLQFMEKAKIEVNTLTATLEDDLFG